VHPYTVKTSSDNVIIVTFDEVSAGWEQPILITADRHWDSVYSDRKMQKRHLDKAKEAGALILDLGDLFDAMQGRADRRGSKDAIRPELLTGDYFTNLPIAAAEWFGPYAEHWLLAAMGNHETGVLKHQETNLTRSFIRLMNSEYGGNVQGGRYGGYIRFQFRGTGRTYFPAITLRYHHGSGGDARVTDGVIQTKRRAVWVPDADVFVSGHIHKTWQHPVPRERVTAGGRVYEDHAMHLSIPTYKKAPNDVGYSAEKEYGPAMNGAIWWNIRADVSDGKNKRMVSEYTWVQ